MEDTIRWIEKTGYYGGADNLSELPRLYNSRKFFDILFT
jgi:hypothetical protein